MSGSLTETRTESFTLTKAKYIASKMGSDLTQLSLLYGKPTDKDIFNFMMEAAILILNEGLDSVEFGFKRNDEVVFSLKYSVTEVGAVIDENPGGVPANLVISDTTWFSYLRHSSKWWKLPLSEREQIEGLIEIKRSGSAEPIYASGRWMNDRTYSSGGRGLSRGVFGVN